MSSFHIQVTRTDNLAQFPTIFNQVATDKTTVGLNLLQGAAQQLSPVYQGLFRNSYSIQVETTGQNVITGLLLNNAPHARVIEGVDAQGNDTEWGRRPGAKFSPINVLALWVQRVLGVQGKAVRQVAFLVARAISRRGIKASRPTQKAWELKQAEIIRLFEIDLPAEIEARI
jgi:hypothetical protein